jgi:hypothetical protein
MKAESTVAYSEQLLVHLKAHLKVVVKVVLMEQLLEGMMVETLAA